MITNPRRARRPDDNAKGVLPATIGVWPHRSQMRPLGGLRLWLWQDFRERRRKVTLVAWWQLCEELLHIVFPY
ncbi:hypothetical protein, partial [Streptosporangium canum]|uniref:hypothetical protein n=1 Tax=Streptosporangium canum TaxID=324952 RepID=UPI0033A8FCE4